MAGDKCMQMSLCTNAKILDISPFEYAKCIHHIFMNTTLTL